MDATLAMISIVAACVWKQLPYMTVMILAGLQSVDSSLLEAACIDGGNPFQRFWHIVLPSIRPSCSHLSGWRSRRIFSSLPSSTI